jgi:hypothetical protein
MMGVCFDRIDLATRKLMRFDVEKGWFPDERTDDCLVGA